LTSVLASINSTSPRHQNNLQIQGLGLLSSILQDKLRTLESKRESVLQELEKTLNEIDITKTQLGKAISEEERQIHLQAIKSIQDFLNLM
jgi:hypothetical protein